MSFGSQISWARFASVTAAFLVATAYGGAEAATEPHEAVHCAPSAQVPPAFQVSSSRPSDLGIRWEIEAEEGFDLVDVTTVTGACASDITGSKMGAFALKSGKGFQIDGGGQVRDHSRAQRAVAPDVLPTEAAPPLPGAEFLHAVRVSARREGGELTSRYLGLWSAGDEWLVAEFQQINTQPAAQARILLRSTHLVSGITYLPSPDASNGRLTLVQVVDQNTARILSYDAPF